MQSKRQNQVAEMIRRNFSLVLQQEGNYIYEDALVTVTTVQVSPDLSVAKIYLSIYNTENKQAVLLLLEKEYHRLKQSLSHRIRKQIRRIPDFTMFIDDTLDEMYKLNALFDRLQTENQMGRHKSEEE